MAQHETQQLTLIGLEIGERLTSAHLCAEAISELARPFGVDGWSKEDRIEIANRARVELYARKAADAVFSLMLAMQHCNLTAGTGRYCIDNQPPHSAIDALLAELKGAM